MNTSANEWNNIRQTYSPDQITHYVETGLDRMYLGTAPTLSAIASANGEERYQYLVAALINEIFKFAGMKDKFPEDVMNTVAHTMRAEYPWLKITELMHFVYLFRLGSYDKFYGKPNGATLMQMLRQYIKGDREKFRSELLERRRREEEVIEKARMRQSGAAASAAAVAAEIAKAFSEEEQAKAAWRYQPYGTAMARAYFVDRTLRKEPWEMDEREQRRWAKDNSAYVKLHPNLNLTRETA